VKRVGVRAPLANGQSGEQTGPFAIYECQARRRLAQEAGQLWTQLAALGDVWRACGTLDAAAERGNAAAGEALGQLEDSCRVGAERALPGTPAW
jgi:hypothetical protein